MGKLIRNGIEYGGGNGTDIFEVTQAEYDALKQAGTLVHNALYVISDAPNLNATASDIEYSSGVSVYQAIPTLDVEESSSVIGVNGTYQIPDNVLAHHLIIVSVRRQGLGNSAIFTKDDLFARDVGFMLASSMTQYCILKCSNTGLLTVLNLTGMSDVFIRVSGIF